MKYGATLRVGSHKLRKTDWTELVSACSASLIHWVWSVWVRVLQPAAHLDLLCNMDMRSKLAGLLASETPSPNSQHIPSHPDCTYASNDTLIEGLLHRFCRCSKIHLPSRKCLCPQKSSASESSTMSHWQCAIFQSSVFRDYQYLWMRTRLSF